jgi:hypothetical protein
METFSIGGKDYIAMGLDDGSLHVYDYTENQDKPASADKPVFVVTKTNEEGKAKDVPPHPDDQFVDNIYEHNDSVTVMEKNYAD